MNKSNKENNGIRYLVVDSTIEGTNAVVNYVLARHGGTAPLQVLHKTLETRLGVDPTYQVGEEDARLLAEYALVYKITPEETITHDGLLRF